MDSKNLGNKRQYQPQGSPLRPLLFNLMINDFVNALCNHVPGVLALHFANGLVICTTGKDFELKCSSRNIFGQYPTTSVEHERISKAINFFDLCFCNRNFIHQAG
ncbi:hypothetical protein TNIN_12431 [Trichonephila inaurata madagascariensis]|uniref:Uncharacterized protein n=1 Tax=Trichonephila inaurata madagascariensis TaxID=2747483 RepID=A0A8X6XGJ5_9ARAC|nr:hypothetical protein TNIN_12431 [Trichonephila inaurata madagascariensis]